MKSTLCQNGYFLLNDGSRRLLKGSMRIEGGRIAAIARSLPVKRGERKVDLKGRLVIPGFVQTHVHLCQTLFRNLADDLQLMDWLRERIWPMEAAHNKMSLYASARLGISELLAGGTTTILDMGTVHHTDQVFRAATEMGIRALIGKCLMDSPDSPDGLREGTQEALAETRKLIRRWHNTSGGRIGYALAPRFLLSCTPTLLAEIRAIAKEHDLIIHTHSSENREEIAAVRKLYGCENVEAFEKLGLTGPRLVLAHCVHLTEKEENILAATRTKVSHCPSSNLKLASGICRVPDLRAKDICVSLGADGAPCNNNLDALREMRLASLLQKPFHGPKALPAREAFEMATIEGARALGLSSEIGSLEAGKRADFVVIDTRSVSVSTELDEKNAEGAYSALVYSVTAENVESTWVDGIQVHDRARPKSAQAIVSSALKEKKKLLSRLKA